MSFSELVKRERNNKMIYTSYFAKLKFLPVNIVPISICAKAPSWYKGLQYKKLALKYDFFLEWKRNHDNDYYIKCFNEQVLDKLNIYEVMYELYEKAGILLDETNIDFPLEFINDKHICLVCYERSSDFCHRHLVSKWFNDNGIACREWTKFMNK